VAQTADFVINAVDNLLGSNALISLRSRGVTARPFEVVQDMERAAETRFRAEERRLTQRLDQLEQQLAALRQGDGAALGDVLTPEQTAAVERFREQMLETRQQLRQVQRALRENVDALEARLWFYNIAAVPLLIAVIAVVQAVLQRRRRRRSMRPA
jgi:ABC-type uncharacterized transport system involved in gliding motility auxiliary subunit